MSLHFPDEMDVSQKLEVCQRCFSALMADISHFSLGQTIWLLIVFISQGESASNLWSYPAIYGLGGLPSVLLLSPHLLRWVPLWLETSKYGGIFVFMLVGLACALVDTALKLSPKSEALQIIFIAGMFLMSIGVSWALASYRYHRASLYWLPAYYSIGLGTYMVVLCLLLFWGFTRV